MALRIGLAGWAYKDWAGIVYPRRLPRGFHQAGYLSEFFDTLEINTSFYQPPRPEICQRWLEQVNANPRFLFTAKLWKKFTHEQGATSEDERVVRAGFDVIRDAGKLGAVLLQFPFSFHREAEKEALLAALLIRFSDYPLVVEMRHSSWNDERFYDLLRKHGAGFCNIDQPLIGRSLNPSERTTAQIGYVRLHGRRYDTWFSDDPALSPTERYNYLYTAAELQPWADRIRTVTASAPTTFIITNNHFGGKGAVNALQLINMLSGERAKAPSTLVENFPQLEPVTIPIRAAAIDATTPSLFPL